MQYFEYLREITQNSDDRYYATYVKRPPYSFKSDDVKFIAFYLPQFYSFPENDGWWGKGFTEWTNVSKAIPQFENHYQPRLPGELGYYNLLTNDVMQRQIDLAKQYGIYGFCFHFYMFDNRKRLLEKPLNKFLESKHLDMPFCLCYANENWTKRWDGLDHEILQKQSYSPTYIYDLVYELKPYLADDRYIRVNDKPLIIIYRISLLPDITNFTKLFRELCLQENIGEVYLSAVLIGEGVDARKFGFDDNIEFPPHKVLLKDVTEDHIKYNDLYNGTIFDYTQVVINELNKSIEFPRMRGVMPSWDNEARKPGRGHTYHGSNPELYKLWLAGVCNKTKEERSKEQRLVFINAWNEWAEGAYLEPDRRYGYAYLEATYQALSADLTMEEVLLQVKQNILEQENKTKVSKVDLFPDGSYMQLFYYQNNTINLTDSQHYYFTDNLEAQYKFDLSGIPNIDHLRLDLTNFPVKANIINVQLVDQYGNYHNIKPCYNNADNVFGSMYLFLHNDPILVYYVKEYGDNFSYLLVDVELTVIKNSEILYYKTEVLQEKIQEIDILNIQVAEKNQIVNAKQKYIDELHNSLSWKLTAPLRKIKSLLSRII